MVFFAKRTRRKMVVRRAERAVFRISYDARISTVRNWRIRRSYYLGDGRNKVNYGEKDPAS